ncbi:MAG TPA: TraR/DksA family transcriptional regulator [Patescibacteria group bacterium]|nr:TraR/DksA family transcriptional regulator [Patescibacteria group bacterium]
MSIKKTSGKAKRSSGVLTIPSKLLDPVAKFLKSSLKNLENRKKTISKEDPFKNTSRLSDNASPDADAEEQFGHARTSAIKEQLDKKIIQTKKALSMIKIGRYGICEDCKKFIDTDRLMAYPEATYCASCQAKREK